MKLTTAELAWVDEKLSGYNIRYQEIHDELKDHLLTAIENLREQGDNRDVELLFTEVVQAQFPGWWPFDDIVKEYQAAYSQKISKTMWANYKHYLNWQTIPFMLLLLVMSFYLPHTKAMLAVVAIALLLVSAWPAGYVYFAGRRIKTDKGKQSLVKRYVSSFSNILMAFFNLLFNGVAVISREWQPAAFLNPSHYPPVIFMLLFCFFMIYSLSCIRLAQQEFKIAY